MSLPSKYYNKETGLYEYPDLKPLMICNAVAVGIGAVVLLAVFIIVLINQY